MHRTSTRNKIQHWLLLRRALLAILVLGVAACDSGGSSSSLDSPVVLQSDTDSDGVGNTLDNCPAIANTDQLDVDGDGFGDACDLDMGADSDGESEGDTDGDTDGDNPVVLQSDTDSDGVGNTLDNCPAIANTDQLDADGDGFGDACDLDIGADPDGDTDGGLGGEPDGDLDGISDANDNCPVQPNPDQSNVDTDSLGDACDDDDDNDGFADADDCQAGDQNIFPGAPDDPSDGIDSDCDGTVEAQPAPQPQPEPQPEPENPVVDGYEFDNTANGAVAALSDPEDSARVGVVQTVPVIDSAVPSSVNTPITLFFNDKLLFESLFNNISVRQNGQQIEGSVTISEGSNGFAILTFVPAQIYDDGATITLTLTGGENGVLDDGGNVLVGNSGDNFEIFITTIDQNAGTFDSNLSFENFDEGVLFSGDGAVLTGALGCLSAIDGSNFAAISTGSAIVSNGTAESDTSSTLQIGPLNLGSGPRNISFDFNFLSGEFQEFVDSIFDDSAVISISGPTGTLTEVITTVSTVGEEGNSECIGIPNFTAESVFEDDYSGQTGWMSRTINTRNIGSPVVITFTVTDVSDTSVTSILAIDNIQF